MRQIEKAMVMFFHALIVWNFMLEGTSASIQDIP
jgi:hypothetical protein